MSGFICIEECGVWQKLAQKFNKRAFTRTNSAGNSNCRHPVMNLNALWTVVSAKINHKSGTAYQESGPLNGFTGSASARLANVQHLPAIGRF